MYIISINSFNSNNLKTHKMKELKFKSRTDNKIKWVVKHG